MQRVGHHFLLVSSFDHLPRTKEAPVQSIALTAPAPGTEPTRSPEEEARDILATAAKNQPEDGPNTRRAGVRTCKYRGGPKLRSQSKEQQTVPKTGPPTLAPEPPEQHQPSACSAFCLPAAFAFALGGITCKHATTKQRITNPRLLPCEQNR